MNRDPVELSVMFGDLRLQVTVQNEDDIGRDGGGFIARANVNGEDFRSAAHFNRIDAIRSLVCWIRDCSSKEGDDFQVTLPLDQKEIRKILYN